MASAEGSIGVRAEPFSGRASGRMRLEALLPLALTVGVALLVLYPMAMVVFGSFWSAAPASPAA